MRKDHGWYPSFLEVRNMAPRDPEEWLAWNDKGKIVCGVTSTLPDGRETVIPVRAGSAIPFDYFQAVGTVIVGLDPSGKPTVIQGTAPKTYDSCWNPRDPEAREYARLSNFMRSWGSKRGEETTVGVEFIEWKRGVLFRVYDDLTAEEVTK